jgi:DEAD/DEAH box helicase domain-containing protein
MPKKTVNPEEIYLDIETLKLSNEVPGGWSSIRNFGIAVAVTWDDANGHRRWFENDALALVDELEGFGRIITFNGDRFDLEVLRGYVPKHNLHARSLDLLGDLHRKLGFRVSLDHIAEHTLGHKKTGDGLKAVEWWRAGQKERVCEYCEGDVKLLVELVRFARERGHVVIDGSAVKVSW